MTFKLQPGWSGGCLNDVIANVTAGTSTNTEDRDFREGDQRILKLSAISGGCFISTESKIVAQGEHSRLRTPVRAGMVLFIRKNTPELVGDSAYVFEDNNQLFLPDLIWAIETTPGVEPRWLNNWLQSDLFRRQIPSLSAGSSQSMVGISQENFLASPILLPPLAEQRRVLGVLDTWDLAIEKSERLLAVKTLSFQKLRAEIFDRFEKLTQPVQLTHVLQPSAKNEPSSLQGRKLLTVKLHCQGVEHNKSHIPRTTRNGRPYYIRRAGEIIIGRQNFHNGGIGIVPSTLDGFLASNAISSFSTIESRANTSYIFHFLARPFFYKGVEVLMGGTGQKELSEAEFLRLRIPLPELSVQQSVGTLLDLNIWELTQTENYLAALRTQKRGLMQKLLTGEWQLDDRFDLDVSARQNPLEIA